METARIIIDSPQTKSVERALDKLAAQAMKQIIAPAVKQAAKDLAGQIKQGVPNGTGTMKQAVGTSPFRYYKDQTVAFQAAGVRRGYGRMIAVLETRTGTKMKRLSKAASAKGANRGYFFSDPAKIAHLIERGRKAIVPKKGKALFDPRTGKFFTHSAEQPGKFFIRQVEQQGTAAKEINAAVENVGKLFSDTLKGQ